MRRLLALIAALMLLAPGAFAKAHKVDYYFISYCERCDPAKDFAAQFEALTGAKLDHCDFHAYNAATDAGRRALQTAMAQLSLPDEVLPMAVVDGVVYRGANELNEKLPPEALKWGGGTLSQVVYLFTPACESCIRAEAVLEALPRRVTVKRGDLSFESEVRVTRYDVTKDGAVAASLFDAYAVPEQKRVTPAVFLPGRALTGIGEIENTLSSYVSLGWAVGEVSAAPTGAGEPGAAGLWGTLAAGLAAGFNGYALTMLLMFLPLVLRLRKNPWSEAAAFLLAKLACCLSVGLLLLGLLQALYPTWPALAARILLTAAAAALALLIPKEDRNHHKAANRHRSAATN